MHRSEKITLIQKTLEAHTELDRQREALEQLVGQFGENAPLYKAICKQQEHALDMCEQLVSDIPNPGQDSWLRWYIYENDCGAKSGEVVVNGTTFQVSNVETLVQVLEHDVEVAELPTDVKELQRLLRIANKKHEADRHYIDNLAFCPDCRDKVGKLNNKECWRCKVENLSRLTTSLINHAAKVTKEKEVLQDEAHRRILGADVPFSWRNCPEDKQPLSFWLGTRDSKYVADVLHDVFDAFCKANNLPHVDANELLNYKLHRDVAAALDQFIDLWDAAIDDPNNVSAGTAALLFSLAHDRNATNNPAYNRLVQPYWESQR